jgi:glucose/arabinose dehydrogenase
MVPSIRCTATRPTRVRLAATVAVLAIVTTACGADDEPAALTGVAPPPTPATAAPDTAADTTAPATTDAGPAPTTPPERPAPTVELFEVGEFDQPVEVNQRPGDTQLFVVEQPGRILAVTDMSREVVLDLTDLTQARGERGLLGLAFHPTEDLAYVHYTDRDGDTVIAEFAVDGPTGAFDRASQREVLTVDQPFSNHNGGQMAFGPDQLLYIGIGDGGSGGDPERYALDLTSRLGKVLRIDPTATDGAPFGIPDDNPFVDTEGADPTIWASGLRNPWRFSFDPETGDLWIADVGQDRFEEINHARAGDGRTGAGRGDNYGWSAFEGFERFNEDQPADGAVPPVFVYEHGEGRCSVSGGAVARGGSVASLEGWYVFGDYCSGEIWALDPANPQRVVPIGSLAALVAISRGPEGELYAVSNAGSIARLVPA